MSGKANVKIKITDKGAARSASQLFGAKKASVTVGVFGEEGEKQAEGEPITMVELAAVHEFGLGVPERSFIRSYFDANADRVSTALLKICKAQLELAVREGRPSTNSELRRVLSKLGLFMVGEIQARIGNGEITPELAEKTIQRKGSSTPLVDTGQLRSSITYEIELDK